MLMRIFFKKPPWYAAGLAFECVRCGNCCAGPQEGYVWVRADEITAIARYLGMEEPELRRKYVREVRGRYSLTERKEGNDCTFLVPDGKGGRKCAIYPVRPMQCRSWPFWKVNLRSANSWALAGMRCPGINRGRKIPRDEIEALANSAKP
ncbi:MAG: YkgJ family cysteine cluster protein [Planctomycetota bacterium]|jgi:Fe-S-cluster containining protein